jgi:hypothetical protein
MHTRRAVNMLVAVALLLVQAGVHAQGKAAPTEASLREAIAHYVATWNRHDVQAWSALLTDDIWYTEADDYYQRMKAAQRSSTSSATWSRPRPRAGHHAPEDDAQWHGDGGHAHFGSPAQEGRQVRQHLRKHASVSRWRIEGDRWRMFYFTSLKGAALAEMKKDGVD